MAPMAPSSLASKGPSTSPTSKLLRNLVFLPWVQYPPLPRTPDLSDPSCHPWQQPGEEEGFDPTNVSHLFLSSPVGTRDSTSRIGAWLMLPSSSSGRVEPLPASATLVLYLHGNASNRSQPHRIALYRVLLALGYYVLAVDYRGFGDSSPTLLSEASVVEDARAALAWATGKLGERCKVVVWGHSLGTAIAAHMVAEADMETGGSSAVCGLVLESPFDSMSAMVATYRLPSVLLARLLDLEHLVLETGVEFASHRWLPAVRCPVLVLHAEDDGVVPHPRGLALEAAARLAGKTDITVHSYPAALGLGHCHIHRAPGLPALIQGFVGGLEAQEERASRLG